MRCPAAWPRDGWIEGDKHGNCVVEPHSEEDLASGTIDPGVSVRV